MRTTVHELSVQQWDQIGYGLLLGWFIILMVTEPFFLGFFCLAAIFVGPVWLALKLMALERDRGER